MSQKISCVIPAYNEAERVGNVLSVLTKSKLIDEIIVVDNGSIDKTAFVVRRDFPGVKVVTKKKNTGKADGIILGVKKTKNPILFTCDADLTGLKEEHIRILSDPVLKGEVRMMVGIQEYLNTMKESDWYRKFLKLKRKPEKGMSDFLKGLGGERVLFKKDFLKVPGLKGSGYEIEQRTIAFFKKKNWSFRLCVLDGVGHVHKIKKWRLKGLLIELKALFAIGKQSLRDQSSS